MSKFVVRGLSAALAVVCGSAPSGAAIVSWGAPQDITGDSDVSLTGTLVGAVNFGTPAGAGAATTTTVNTVTFDAATQFFPATGFVNYGPFTVGTVGTIAVWGGFPTGTTFPPFSSLSGPYQALLRGGMAAGVLPLFTSATLQITMNNLTPGLLYEFQVWSNLSNGDRVTRFSDGVGFVDLTNDVGDFAGAVGEFALGTFIADGPTQTIFVDGADPQRSGFVNAIQLRLVPGPGSAAALLGGGLLALRRRR